MKTTNEAAALPFSVNEWGSNPDAGNDDCWQGRDYATLEEALADYNDESLAKRNGSTRWIEIDGPGINQSRQIPGLKPLRYDDANDWKREIAIEAGMLHGIDAYNDEMGY